MSICVIKPGQEKKKKKKKKVASHSGNRTRAAWVKTRNPNH